MRHHLLPFTSYLLLITSPAFPQSVIRTLPWEVDTARPALKEWSLVRGETADLECRYLTAAASMDVAGASVLLHARTNGMPSGLSFQVTGTVGRAGSTNLASVGWVTIRVRPGQDLPHDAKSCAFVIETVLADARNLVASGTLRLQGDPTGASPAALPLYQYDPAGSAQAASNALASALHGHAADTANPHAVTAIQTGAATTQQLAQAIAPLATTFELEYVVGALATTQDLSMAIEPLATISSMSAKLDRLSGDPSSTSASWEWTVRNPTDMKGLSIGNSEYTSIYGGIEMSIANGWIRINPWDGIIVTFGANAALAYAWPQGPASRISTIADIQVAIPAGLITNGQSGVTLPNLTTRGWLALPQAAPTNLVLRLVTSNEHIIVQEVYQ